jgi:hypothetical protein
VPDADGSADTGAVGEREVPRVGSERPGPVPDADADPHAGPVAITVPDQSERPNATVPNVNMMQKG